MKTSCSYARILVLIFMFSFSLIASAQDDMTYKSIFSLDYGAGKFNIPMTALLKNEELYIAIDMYTPKTECLTLYYDEDDIATVRRRLSRIADNFEQMINSNQQPAALPIVLPETIATWDLTEEKDIDLDNVKFTTLYSSLDGANKCIIIKCDLSGYSDEYSDYAFWVFVSPQEIKDFVNFINPTRVKNKIK